MKIKISLEQLSVLSNKKKKKYQISESQVNKLKNLFNEQTSAIGVSSDTVDETTSEVILKNLEDPSGVDVMIINNKTNEPDEPTLQSLVGKKRWDVVKIEKDGQIKEYKIVNISSFITKSSHQNFDNVKSIKDLMTKLNIDRYFIDRVYKLSENDFNILETLKNKGEKIDRIAIQIYYLLYRRSGTIKRFATKLNLFLPFMEMLLKKEEPIFSCIMEKLELALADMDESLLKSFSDKKENFEKLYIYLDNLNSCDDNLSIDILSFFKSSEYFKYEKEFVGSHFKHSPSSVSIEIKLNKDLPDLNSKDFNPMINLDKMNSILKWVLTNKKNSALSYQELFNVFVENLTITFPKIIKKDLEVINPIFTEPYNEDNEPVLKNGDFVEVKFKNYDKPDFLCEFFKPESHNASMEFLVNELIKIDDRVNSSVEVLKLISLLDNTLVNKIKESNIGQEVIDGIKNTTSGMIFKDFIYVRMDDIDLQWTNIGYASKPRIAIKYSVKDGAKKYKLNLDKKDQDQINAIFLID